MSLLYSEYKLNNTGNINILKDDYTFNYNNYEKMRSAQEYNKVYTNSMIINQENKQLKEDKRIYNLSMKQIVTNASQSYINLINDLSVFFTKDKQDRTLNQFGYIISKDDNLIYIGLLIVVLSLILYLLNVSK
jgi:hypothetical protein